MEEALVDRTTLESLGPTAVRHTVTVIEGDKLWSRLSTSHGEITAPTDAGEGLRFLGLTSEILVCLDTNCHDSEPSPDSGGYVLDLVLSS